MIQFKYNSNHKLITAIAIVLWAIFRFTGDNETLKQYDNGQIKKSGGFTSAKNQGKWTWYYENGGKKMEGAFLAGKRDGVWVTWDANGNKITEGYYQNDMLNGKFVRWDANGNMEEHLTYQNDKVVQKLSLNNPVNRPQ